MGLGSCCITSPINPRQIPWPTVNDRYHFARVSRSARPGVEADIGLPACLQPTVVDVFHDRRPRQDSNLRTRFRKAKRRRKRRSRRVPNRTISAGQRGYYGRERKQPDPDGSRVVGVGWRGGPAPPRSHRSRRESLLHRALLIRRQVRRRGPTSTGRTERVVFRSTRSTTAGTV